jgi:hypothetical protein
MTTAPAKATERSGDESDGRDHAFHAASLRDVGRQSSHMTSSAARSRSLVSRARNTSARAKARSGYGRTRSYRRKECATDFNVSPTAQPSVAPFATESLALSGTTPGEPLSVQRNAPIDSRPVERTIAGSCLGFRPPDRGRGDNFAASSRSSFFRSTEVAQ